MGYWQQEMRRGFITPYARVGHLFVNTHKRRALCNFANHCGKKRNITCGKQQKHHFWQEKRKKAAEWFLGLFFYESSSVLHTPQFKRRFNHFWNWHRIASPVDYWIRILLIYVGLRIIGTLFKFWGHFPERLDFIAFPPFPHRITIWTFPFWICKIGRVEGKSERRIWQETQWCGGADFIAFVTNCPPPLLPPPSSLLPLSTLNCVLCWE